MAHLPEPPEAQGLTGLAEELSLSAILPAVLRELGQGWWEYGLVERAYAAEDPRGWQQMVDRWSDTAIQPKRYTASSYLAGVLGRLSGAGFVAFHPGRGTGRWSYNSDISWWSTVPPGPWEHRTAWVDVMHDEDEAAQLADLECRTYVGAL